jgi:hypothetical protein
MFELFLPLQKFWLSFLEPSCFDNEAFHQFTVHNCSSQLRKFFNFYKIECMRHTKGHTLWFPVTQVALVDHMLLQIEVNISKRTCHHAHFAANTAAFIHNDRIGFGITLKGSTGADLHTGCCITLGTGERRDEPLARVDVHPYVRIFPAKSSGPIERTGHFTVPAADTAIKFNRNDFHDCSLFSPFFDNFLLYLKFYWKNRQMLWR